VLSGLAFLIVSDLSARLIPDKITFPLIIYVLVVATISGRSALGRGLLGGLVAGAAILVLAVVTRGGIGGGDLKLMVFVGAALGWKEALTLFVVSQVLALAAAMVLTIVRRAIFRGTLPVGAIIAALAAIALLTMDVQTTRSLYD
jgi:leader peptidase (prepilin peptidase) / N-methyltransferase